MVILVGNGAHGSDIAVIYERVFGHKVFTVENETEVPNTTAFKVFLGINNPQTRRNIAWKLEHLKGAKALVDPSAIVGPRVSLGRGSVVAPQACLLHSVELGDHVHVNYHASMTRCVIGDYTTVAPGATICGDVIVGETCFIGAGATVSNLVTLGNEVVVAAGAIIPPRSVVPDGAKVIGVWKQ